MDVFQIVSKAPLRRLYMNRYIRLWKYLRKYLWKYLQRYHKDIAVNIWDDSFKAHCVLEYYRDISKDSNKKIQNENLNENPRKVVYPGFCPSHRHQGQRGSNDICDRM